jgi:hypothetical protein
MTGMLQFKNLTGSVKDVDTKNNVITGYLSAFNNEDFDKDVILPGSFKRSLDTRRDKILFLNQHKWEQPHGGFAVLKEDSHGLYFESNPLIDTSYSRDAIKLYSAGIMKEHSIGFQVVQSDYDNEKGIRQIKEIKLYEGSNVTMGANPNTPFRGFKSVNLKDINDQVKAITNVIRNGDLTDETFVQLEIALKQLQLASFNLGKEKAFKKKDDPTHVTRLDLDPLISVFKKHTII